MRAIALSEHFAEIVRERKRLPESKLDATKNGHANGHHEIRDTTPPPALEDSAA